MLSIEATARKKKKKHYSRLIEGKFGSSDEGIREPRQRGNDTRDKTAAQPAFYANSASFELGAAVLALTDLHPSF